MAELRPRLVPQSAGVPAAAVWDRSLAQGRTCAIDVGRRSAYSARLYRASAQEPIAARDRCALKPPVQRAAVLQRRHLDTGIDTRPGRRVPRVARSKSARDGHCAAVVAVVHDLASRILARDRRSLNKSRTVTPGSHWRLSLR